MDARFDGLARGVRVVPGVDDFGGPKGVHARAVRRLRNACFVEFGGGLETRFRRGGWWSREAEGLGVVWGVGLLLRRRTISRWGTVIVRSMYKNQQVDILRENSFWFEPKTIRGDVRRVSSLSWLLNIGRATK